MKAAVLEARGFAAWPAKAYVGMAAVALVIGILALVLTVAIGEPAGSGAAQAKVQLAPANAAELVQATVDSPERWSATGDRAKLINASLPFSAAPIQSANSFSMQGPDLDYRRALLCLTQAVYYEAGFEPMAGRRAVAQVVLNRMRHPAFPNSVCGVVYQVARAPVCQFSFVCDGSLNRAPSRPAWEVARKIAEAALAGYVEQSVGSATHYHADYVAPRWAPMLTKINKLGAHIFYRWPGAWGLRGAFTDRYAGEPNDPLALRPAQRVIADGPAPVDTTAAVEVAAAGPPVARAVNDVGGLLDTSKGWTLSIPSPAETSSSAAQILAQQQSAAPARATAAAVALSAPPLTR